MSRLAGLILALSLFGYLAPISPASAAGQLICYEVSALNCQPVGVSAPLPVTVAGGSSGNGLVQTSPPSYSNGASQPPTLQTDGSIVTNGAKVLGTYTCSVACSTTGIDLVPATNMWNYNELSFSVSALSGSWLKLQCDNGDNNYQQVLPLVGYVVGGSLTGQSLITTIGLWDSPVINASRCKLSFVFWGGETVTVTVYGSNGVNPATTVTGYIATSINDLENNNNIPPVVCGSAVSSCVLKNSAGLLYGVYATCTANCWLMVFNAASAPSNGATTAGIAASDLQECVPISANGVGAINYLPGPPSNFTTGITAVISSTNCATLTLATTGFIHGVVR